MKTPIQELIEKYQELRENGDNDMRTVIYFAESMLEKEKELACKFARKYDLELSDGIIRSVEDCFDEMFNTEEQ